MGFTIRMGVNMLIERILFNLLAVSFFIFIFFKMIRRNDTGYITVLVIQALGIMIGFFEILFHVSWGYGVKIAEYILAIVFPIAIILLEKKNYNFTELVNYASAKFFLFFGNTRLAKKRLVRLTEQYPKNPSAHKLLGKIYEKEGGTRKAIDEYVQAIELNKKDYDTYYQIAYLLDSLDKKDEAIEMLNNLMNKKPDYYKASQLLGRLLCEKEQFKDAIAVYMNALRYNPDDYDIYYDLGIAYTRLNDFQNAKICYEKAADINSSLYHADYCLGMISLLYDDIDEAEKFFSKAIQGELVEAKSYYQLSRISILKGEKEKAINYLNIAIDMDAKFSQMALQDPVFIPIQRYIPTKTNSVEQTEETRTMPEKERKAQEHLEQTYLLTGSISKNDLKKLHTLEKEDINMKGKEREE